jgi:Rod binding domain-containing protein
VASDAWKAKLSTGAHEFEAMMLEQMMKPLQFGGAPGADPESAGSSDGEAQDAASDIIRGFGTQAMAKAIASGGGFGLATQIIRQVTHEHNAQKVNSDSTKVGQRHADGTG